MNNQRLIFKAQLFFLVFMVSLGCLFRLYTPILATGTLTVSPMTLIYFTVICLFFLYTSIFKFRKYMEESRRNYKKTNLSKNKPVVQVQSDSPQVSDLQQYPELADILVEIMQYKQTLKRRNYRLNSYFKDSVKYLLNLYDDVVSMPIRNTETGKQTILEIRQGLYQIRDSLKEICKKKLEETQIETEIFVKTLNNKLISDGFLPSTSDIHSNKIDLSI